MGAGGRSPEEEFEEFKEMIDDRFIKSDRERFNYINENHISGRSFDILVLDYGGVLPGTSLPEMMIHEFVKLLSDNPSREFILFSFGMQNLLEGEIEQTIGIHPREIHNLHITGFSNPYDKICKVIKDWLRFN